jgi:hypothetical protein
MINHDIMNVKAVIDERRRTVNKIDLGRESSLAVRREIENAVWVDGHSARKKGRGWLARLRQLHLGRAKSRKIAGHRGIGRKTDPIIARSAKV